MRISVIIRTLNEEANIGDCLRRLADQELMPAEVLVVDNQSSDRTVEIARQFSGRLPLKVLSNPVIGFASGLNLGFQESTSDWVLFLSADCLPDKGWLHWLGRTAEQLDAHAVHDRCVLSPENDVTYVLESEAGKAGTEPQRLEFFSNTNILYRKSSLAPHMPFTGIGALGYAEDTMMSLEFKKYHLRAYIEPRAISYNRSYPDSQAFKERMILHGKMQVALLRKFPLYPRLYLNSLYWSIKEISLFLLRRDTRFLKVGITRFAYTSKGMLSAILARRQTQSQAGTS